MNDHEVRELLSDAVSDVEPAHRLSEIQARTATPKRGSGWFIAGGSILATAAAVTAVALVISTLGVDDDGPDPAPTGTPSAIETQAVPAYYIGDTPYGPRLYREFANVDANIPKLEASLSLLENGPADPDYTTAWGPGSFADASVQGDVIYVELADESLHDRPADMTKAEAGLAIEQVIYTVQGAVGQGRLPVQFRLNGNPTNETLGEPTSEPLAESPQLDVLAFMSISDPAQGAVVSGSFIAQGVASAYEATVVWQVRDGDEAIVADGFTTADGYLDKLWPWRTEVDVSGLEPGTYTFVAITADGSGISGAPGATYDTRTIVVE